MHRTVDVLGIQVLFVDSPAMWTQKASDVIQDEAAVIMVLVNTPAPRSLNVGRPIRPSAILHVLPLLSSLEYKCKRLAKCHVLDQVL